MEILQAFKTRKYCASKFEILDEKEELQDDSFPKLTEKEIENLKIPVYIQ